MKKILCAVLVVLFAGTAHAETVGALSRLNMSSEEFQSFMVDRYSKRIEKAARSRKHEELYCRYYASLSEMLMSLQAGRIDTIFIPECVADYVLRENPGTESRGFVNANGLMGLTMGFREDSAELRGKVDDALKKMTKDGTSSLLARRYITGSEALTPKPAKFDTFKDAPAMKVAVTGDLPPIDYVDAGGEAAGFNTALLAELGRRLQMNITMIQVEAGARASALISGRVDCVFWFALHPGKGQQWDIPPGIIVTSPYFSWNKDYFIGLKK